MKKPRNNTLIALFLFSILPLGCESSFTTLELKRGITASEEGDYSKAVGFFRRVIKRSPESKASIEAAEKAAYINVYHLKKYKEAIDNYKYVVLYSKSDQQRKKAQVSIGDIYFEKLQDYAKALDVYSKLITLKNSKDEIYNFKMRMAKSYFYLQNYFQAKVEISDLLKNELSEQQNFEANHFLGNVHFTLKSMDEAIKVYKSLIERHPVLSNKEKVPLSVVVCYEELKDYDQAIKLLEEMKINSEEPEYLELKIKRLKSRKQNLPGFKGLRK